jgi:hypothetical protein
MRRAVTRHVRLQQVHWPCLTTSFYSKPRHFITSSAICAKHADIRASNTSALTDSSIHVPAVPPSPSACIGCGVLLQSKDAASLGYNPPQKPGTSSTDGEGVVDNAMEPKLICQRCHRAKYYGHLVPVTVPYAEFKTNFVQIMARTDNVVLVVVDVGDVHGTFPVDISNPEFRGRASDVIVVRQGDVLECMRVCVSVCAYVCAFYLTYCVITHASMQNADAGESQTCTQIRARPKTPPTYSQ